MLRHAPTTMKAQSGLQRARAKLLAQLEQQQGMHEQACCALEFERERQKILAEFISSQVETERILAHFKALMEDGGDEAEDNEGEAAAYTAGAAAEAVPHQCANWVMAIMARITKRHIQQALQMTAEDWIQLHRTGFQNCMLLLELFQRSEEPAAGSCQDIRRQPYSENDMQQQQPGRTDDSDKAASTALTAASTAAASAGPGLAAQGCWPPSEQPPEDPDGWTAPAIANLLDDIFDATSLFMAAAMFHNPAPYYAAAACNQVTGQVATASSAHLRLVLRRLKLSRRQLLHLAIIASEFARLSRATRKEGEFLAEQAARLSLSALAGSLEDEKTLSGRQGSNQPSASAAHAGSAGSAGAAAAEEGPAAAAERDAGSGGPSRNDSATAAPSADGTTCAPAVAVAAADESSHPGDQTAGPTAEELSQQLQRHLDRRHLHTLVTAWSVVNTLTLRQIATFTVASFPFSTNTAATAEAALALYLQQQHQARPSSSSNSQGVGGGGDDDDASAAWRQEVEAHMAHRAAVLEMQLEQWWQQLLPPLQQDGDQQQQQQQACSLPASGNNK